MPDPAAPASPFSPASLHDAVQQTLAAADVPEHHGFAAVVDVRTGAHVGVATRTASGWSFEADGGYDWAGDQKGLNGRFTIGKSW